MMGAEQTHCIYQNISNFNNLLLQERDGEQFGAGDLILAEAALRARDNESRGERPTERNGGGRVHDR